MPRPSVDRESIKEFVNEFVEETGVRPGTKVIVGHFHCSPQTAQGALAALDAKGELEGTPLRPWARTDRRDEVMRAIRSYQLTNTWAPTQREIAEMIGCGLQRANSTVEQLAAEGRLVVGPYPRQLYITGTIVKIPEVKEPK